MIQGNDMKIQEWHGQIMRLIFLFCGREFISALNSQGKPVAYLNVLNASSPYSYLRLQAIFCKKMADRWNVTDRAE